MRRDESISAESALAAGSVRPTDAHALWQCKRALDELMAFLVCYSESPPNDDWKNKAIYLNQAFYATIYKRCRRNATQYPLLAQIAALDYDGELVVDADQIAHLIAELAALQSSLWFRRKPIDDFIAVCERAEERGVALKIGGDMYPVYGHTRS